MIVKISALFLLVIVALAVFGRLRRAQKAKTSCGACGRPRIGSGACPCGAPGGRGR